MRRRDLLRLVGSAAICWALSARAQQPAKIYRLGYLASARIPILIEALQTGLRELGYVEGKNLKTEYRFGGQDPEALRKLAAELVALGPDAIVTVASPPAIAAKRATTTIPIVMATVGDPLRSGLIASLAHPGGNITGVTLYGSELSGKRVEVIREALPGISRVAVLGNAANAFSRVSWEDTQPVARQMGINPQLFMVREPWRRPSTRPGGQLLQLGFQQIEIDRLGDEFHGAVFGGAATALVVAIGGHHHHGQFGAPLLEDAQQFEPVHARHVDIRQDDDELRLDLAGEAIERLLARGREM
jgi:hypothetical protein